MSQQSAKQLCVKFTVDGSMLWLFNTMLWCTLPFRRTIALQPKFTSSNFNKLISSPSINAYMLARNRMYYQVLVLHEYHCIFMSMAALREWQVRKSTDQTTADFKQAQRQTDEAASNLGSKNHCYDPAHIKLASAESILAKAEERANKAEAKLKECEDERDKWLANSQWFEDGMIWWKGQANNWEWHHEKLQEIYISECERFRRSILLFQGRCRCCFVGKGQAGKGNSSKGQASNNGKQRSGSGHSCHTNSSNNKSVRFDMTTNIRPAKQKTECKVGYNRPSTNCLPIPD